MRRNSSPWWAGTWCRVCLCLLGLVAGLPVWALGADWQGLTPPARQLSDPGGSEGVARISQRFAAGEGVPVAGREIYELGGAQVQWFAIDLPAILAPRAAVFSVPHAGINHLTFYWQGEGGRWLMAESGDQLPVADWPMPYLHPAFDFVAQPGYPRVYLSVQHSQPMGLFWRLWDRRVFDDSSRLWHLAIGVYGGCLLLVVVLNLIQAAVWRESLPLYLALSVACTGLAMASLIGLGGEYLWPALPHWNDLAAVVLPALAMASLPLFLSRLMAAALPGWVRHGLLAMAAFGLLFALGFLLLGRKPLFIVSNLYDLAALALCVWSAWLYARRNPRAGAWVVVACVLLMAGAMLPILRNLGLIPLSDATQYAAPLTALFEIPLLMTALQLWGRQRRDQQVRQHALSPLDALTGLCHERVVIERLDHLILRQHRNLRLGAVMRIRISNLQALFSQCGPQVAEEVTLQASQCIARLVRRSGDTLGRLGNGDFVLLMEGEPKPQAVQDAAQLIIARGLALTLKSPAGEPLRLHVACTAGLYPGCDAAALLGRLDTLLGRMGTSSSRALYFLKPGEFSPKSASQPAELAGWSEGLPQRTRMPGVAPGQGFRT